MKGWPRFLEMQSGDTETVGLSLVPAWLLGPEAAALQVWLAVLLGAAVLGGLFLLHRVYRKRLVERAGVLSLRFRRKPRVRYAVPLPLATTTPGATPQETLRAIEQLHAAGSEALFEYAEHLLHHPDHRVRHRVLGLVGHRIAAVLLRQLALNDPDPALRELASRLSSQSPAVAELLHHPDAAVRKGALRGRLDANPDDAQAQACLSTEAASAETSSRLVALALIGFLPPPRQAELVVACLRSAQPALVQAAVEAAPAATASALVAQLLALLGTKALRPPAVDCLVRLGDATLARLPAAFAQETNERRLQALAQVCARLATPAARQLLVAVAHGATLPGRTAALRALADFATVPADAPLFHRLVEDEMKLAQHLLHGLVMAPADLRAALLYELRKGQQRLFGVLLQLYQRPLILAAQLGAAHTSGARQACALEPLENLVPRPLYRGLQALLDVDRTTLQAQIFDDLLGPSASVEPIQATIVRRGEAAFSAWTICVALRQWHPQPATVAHLYPHLHTADVLVRESAWAVLRQLSIRRPAAYDQLLALHPSLSLLLMTTPAPAACGSVQERVLLLKGTALFAETPENILGTIVPIMKEVVFEPEQEIFVKGTLGTSLFIVCEGEVGIFNGTQQLASFGKGDFFGELALLDAEPRSATAVAISKVVTFRLDQEDFYDVMEERSEVLRNILRVLCQRLRRQNEKMPVALASPR